jgi:hypothetical protein
MRKATPADTEKIFRMVVAYFLENQEKRPMKITLDVDGTRRFLKEVLGHKDLISYLSDDGVILGELGRLWMAHERVSRGILWYVKPEARNGILARNLLRAFDKEAKERSAVYSKMDLDNPANIHIIEPFCKLMGYEEFSKSWVKEF